MIITNEKEFLNVYLPRDRKRLKEHDSRTAKAYATRRHLWLFDKDDGHLALKYDRITKTRLYECEHIKIGRKKFGR